VSTYNPTFFSVSSLPAVAIVTNNEGEHLQHWEDAAIPFWLIASDGVTYSQPIQRKAIVMVGGQREELLLQFDQPGTYVISQQGIQGTQFFDMNGHSTLGDHYR